MGYRTPLTFLVAVICAQFANADPQTEQVRKLAAENSAAYASENYARLVDLTYPKLVELIGGRDRMIEMLRQGTEDLKARSSKILGAEVSEPKEIVTAGDRQFAIVPEVVRVQGPEGTLRSNSFLIAVSEDRGKTWTFIDGAGLHNTPGKERDTLAQIVPGFPSQLALPAWEPPALESK